MFVIQVYIVFKMFCDIQFYCCGYFFSLVSFISEKILVYN